LTSLFARWFALSLAEKSRTLEAAATLLRVRLIFGLLPFARALRLLRIEQGQVVFGRMAAAEATDIARAISRAMRHVPFRTVCLQEAFAASLMLRRRGFAATVRMGARRGSDYRDLTAHAWCCSGTVPVTGFPMAYGFVAVATFST
jgi:hypothetical protein